MWKSDKVVFTLFILLVGCLTETDSKRKKNQQISILLVKKKKMQLLLSEVKLNCIIPKVSREKCPCGAVEQCSSALKWILHWKLNELIYRKSEKVRLVRKWSQETHVETYVNTRWQRRSGACVRISGAWHREPTGPFMVLSEWLMTVFLCS